MAVTPASGEFITVGSILDYEDDKVLLGSGSFGVVYGTRKGGERVAVKVVHIPRQWRRSIAMLEREVIPLHISALYGWKHVNSCKRAFVHENLCSDLDDIKTGKGNRDRSTSALSIANDRFWAMLLEKMTSMKGFWKSGLCIEMPMADASLRSMLGNWGQQMGHAGVQAAVTDTFVAMTWFADLCCGVNELHSKGYMHRDLKPDNCLLFMEEGRSRLRISDLGSSRKFGSTAAPNQTKGVCTLWYSAPEILAEMEYDASMDIWSAGCIFRELLVGKPTFAHEDQRNESDMLKAIAACYHRIRIPMIGFDDHGNPLPTPVPVREALSLPAQQNEFFEGPLELDPAFVELTKSRAGPFAIDVITLMLNGTLAVDATIRFSSEDLVKTANKLIKASGASQKLPSDSQRSRKQPVFHTQTIQRAGAIFGASVAAPSADLGAGAHQPGTVSITDAPWTSELFDQRCYFKNGRRAEWARAVERGQKFTQEWQKLRVCRCHGQCGGGIQHENRRHRPCGKKGEVKVTDNQLGFNYFLCPHCACSKCQSQQGMYAFGGKCKTCSGNDQVVPASKRNAADREFFNTKRRRNIIMSRPAAALSRCSEGKASRPPVEIKLEGALGIVYAFRATLNNASPSDARMYVALPVETPVYKDMFMLSLKEPWVIDLYKKIDEGVEQTMAYRKEWREHHKLKPATEPNKHEKEKMRRAVRHLLQQAAEQMQNPTAKMQMQRRILSEQYGLIWYGALMTFRNFGLVGTSGYGEYVWAGKKYFLTGNYEKLDKFIDEFVQFASEHPRPRPGDSLDTVDSYVEKLSGRFADVHELKKTARERYIGPHATRKMFLRIEDLTQEKPASEHYMSLEQGKTADDARSNYWQTKALGDLRRLSPDSNAHLQGQPLGVNLLDFALRFQMHPLMVSCWTCLIGKAVDDYGYEQTRVILHDDNASTAAIFQQHLARWGDDLPPSMTVLMEACGAKKVPKKKKNKNKSGSQDVD